MVISIDYSIRILKKRQDRGKYNGESKTKDKLSRQWPRIELRIMPHKVHKKLCSIFLLVSLN